MADDPIRKDDGDELLERADALLTRHRGANAERTTQTSSATNSDAHPDDGGDELADIPMLTEIVIEDPPVSGRPAAPAPAGESSEAAEVMSRVQVQNLEHSVYQKLKRELDERIMEVMRERMMRELGLTEAKTA